MQPENRLAAAIAIACAGLPGLSQAQTQSIDTSKNLEQVIVTGSRVKRPEYEGNIPGVQASAEQIELRNFDNAIDVLNDIPLVGGGATPNGTNGGQPSSVGASFVDLLDLGTARTLTLVNGRRVVSGNAGSLFVAGNETGGQVDVNVIPADLIERVDVLTVGGAVAYGADAISGVVNYILKDDFEGMKGSVRGAQTARGDGMEMSVRSTFGTNFANSRGNVFAHLEYIDSDGIQADSRSFRRRNGGAVTAFDNGSRRNPNFAPGIIDVTGLNNGAFFRAADDGISGSSNLDALTAANLSPGGTIFNLLAPSTLGGANGQIGTVNQTFTAGNTQLINGAPNLCNPGAAANAAASNPFICNFAPTTGVNLPAGVSASQIFSAFNVTPPAGLTAAQQTLLAFNVIQANRPTAREFFAQNPNTPLNAFLGSFINAFPDIANTDPATRGLLPRLAVPLRFNNNGSIERFNVATLNPDTPSSIGGAVGGDGFNPIFNTTLRVEQERSLGFFGGHYDFTDNLRFVSENSYSNVESASARGAASANTAGANVVETAALVIGINNPFLTDANRAVLRDAGITDAFVLSRTNQDIQGANGTSNRNRTFRTVQGLEGDFEMLGRTIDWDVSGIYGFQEQETRTQSIKDVEFALAIDSAIDPTTGQIVCRSQLPGQGATPLQGVSQQIVRVIGPDGLPTETLTNSVVVPTLAQVAACQPLNPFGFNQMSAGAREYVLGRQRFDNTNEQRAGQANISFPIMNLPAGELGFGASFEYREEEIDFSANEVAANGRTRFAAIATTKGQTETTEYGAEVRIPIFGGEWTFPGLYALDIGGGVRRTTQDGSAPAFRNLAGEVITQESNGEPQNITSIRANWSPIESVRFRAERTRAVRQPSVVELFLGGQPAFNTPADPCSNQNITAGPNAAVRQANCIADVIARGIATDPVAAANFLSSFRANGVGLQGTFAGSPTLAPEKADSWTAGVVFTPTFVRGLRASVDYISIDLTDIINPTTQTEALNFCFDGSQFPDNSSSFGVNTCSLTRRDENYQLTSGFTLGFLNLAAQELRALNGTLQYEFDLGDVFGGGNWGRLGLDYNHYHLFAFRESASGRFDDTTQAAGSVGNPRNESRLSANYNRGPLTVGLTWQYTDHSKVFNGGAPATIDAVPLLELPSFDIYDISATYRWSKYRANFTMFNALDKNLIGSVGGGAFVDQLGRRFALTFTADFQ
jgi:outer membrane receptor protein involved in Fe transport